MHKNVFISYSRDSDSHIAKIKDLSDRLRSDGINCLIDEYFDFPEFGWLTWMRENIEKADYVLIVFTPKYRDSYLKNISNPGKGTTYESHLIFQKIYDNNLRNNKFIPLILDNGSIDHIPDDFKKYSFFKISENYENYYKIIVNQGKEIPSLGKIEKFQNINKDNNYLANLISQKKYNDFLLDYNSIKNHSKINSSHKTLKICHTLLTNPNITENSLIEMHDFLSKTIKKPPKKHAELTTFLYLLISYEYLSISENFSEFKNLKNKLTGNEDHFLDIVSLFKIKSPLLKSLIRELT